MHLEGRRVSLVELPSLLCRHRLRRCCMLPMLLVELPSLLCRHRMRRCCMLPMLSMLMSEL